jgi:hypothetical protein
LETCTLPTRKLLHGDGVCFGAIVPISYPLIVFSQKMLFVGCISIPDYRLGKLCLWLTLWAIEILCTTEGSKEYTKHCHWYNFWNVYLHNKQYSALWLEKWKFTCQFEGSSTPNMQGKKHNSYYFVLLFVLHRVARLLLLLLCVLFLCLGIHTI